MALVPHSVRMRQLGMVRDPAIHGHTYGQSVWVPKGTTVADRQNAYRTKVNRVVDVLTRFVANWVKQSRIARSAYKCKARAEAWHASVWSISWANIMESEENRSKAIVDAYYARLVAMTDRELNEYSAAAIREIRQHNEDVMPWLETMRIVRAKREIAQVAIAENRQVWQEMSIRNIGVPVRLHNTQAVAKKRVVRVQNSFSALDSSDSE